jgi:hypothetical protein
MESSEIRKIAREIIAEIHEQKHEFWIDGETHYNEHAKIKPLSPEDVMALKDAATAFRSVSKTFMRISFLVVILAAALLAVLAALGKIRLV